MRRRGRQRRFFHQSNRFREARVSSRPTFGTTEPPTTKSSTRALTARVVRPPPSISRRRRREGERERARRRRQRERERKRVIATQSRWKKELLRERHATHQKYEKKKSTTLYSRAPLFSTTHISVGLVAMMTMSSLSRFVKVRVW